MVQEVRAGEALEVIEPDLPIVDAHHHLWLHPRGRYLIEEFQADLADGHDVLATVYVECSSMYRASGPEPLRPVGEAEFVAGMAAMSDSGLFGPTRVCAAFVGAADFRLGEAVDEVLDALAMASGGRLKGIRGSANWDADPVVRTRSGAFLRGFAPPGLLLDSRFRAGVARLAPRNLAYDAWQFHPQLPELCSLADGFPDLPIIVNHCGALLGIGSYASPDAFSQWKALVADAARRPNILVKLGGLAPPRCGFAYDQRSKPATAEELARDWKPYIETCVELFGPSRCMFESNFPVDKIAGSYRTIWNAFKVIASGCSAREKRDLFSGSAARAYGISLNPG
jgi:predicted TIM-barrel fold metal-dependent hydrolase